MVVAHNLQAMNAQRQLGITTANVAKSTEKLSSGYKVNRSADDAAGLSISEKMRKQIRGLDQASLNAEDGISMIQIADGAMAEIHDMLDRGVELSVKAANGTLSYSDRQSIQDEIDQIKLEIDGIKERTKFNEIYVLKGERQVKTTDIPAGIEKVGKTFPSWINFGSALGDGYMTDVYTTDESFIEDNTVIPPVILPASVDHAAAIIDFTGLNASNIQDLIGCGFNSTCCTCSSFYSVEFVSGSTNSSEMTGSHFVYKIGIDGITTGSDLIDKIIDGTDAGFPNGHYTRYAHDKSDANKLVIYDVRRLSGSADPTGWGPNSEWTTHVGEIGYSASPRPDGKFGEGIIREKMASVATDWYETPQSLALHIGADAENRMPITLPLISCKSLFLDKVDVRSITGADNGITAFSKAKDLVSKDRSRMGAYQNRLDHTVKNLDNVVENTTAAESQIRDTEMAAEMVSFSKNNILKQAGQSMLSQANQFNQGVLSLIA